MGEKVEALRSKIKGMPENDPIREAALAMARLLHTKAAPTDVYGMADMVMHLESVKRIVESVYKAAGEEFERRKKELYDHMLEHETQSFSRKGKTFYQTTVTYVRAKDELGGRSNPDLRAWLADNGLGDIVKQDINYQTLQGSVNDWIDKNPIEVVRNGDNLEGQELLDALGVTQAEYDHLVAEHERLRGLVDIGESFTVGMKKA